MTNIDYFYYYEALAELEENDEKAIILDYLSKNNLDFKKAQNNEDN